MGSNPWTPRSDWARSAADSAYPEMWDGLVSAWVPSVGCLGGGKALYDVGPWNRNWTSLGGGNNWELDPRIGLTIQGSGSLVNWYSGPKVPYPLPTFSIVAIVKPVNGYGGSNRQLTIAGCNTSSQGFRCGWWHPASGAFITTFDMTTALDAWSASPVNIGISSGVWYVAVYRYDGKTKWIELYDQNGKLTSGSATLVNGGPVTYYYGSQNACYMLDGYDSTDRQGGCLIFGKDIGPGRSMAFGKGGPFARNWMKPFLSRPSQITTFAKPPIDCSASSDLTLSSEAGVTNFSRGINATSTLDLAASAGIATFSLSFSASTTLELSDSAGAASVRSVEAESTLTLSVAAEKVDYTITDVSAESTLSLSDAAQGRHAHFRPVAESTLTLDQSAFAISYNVYDVSAESFIFMFDWADGRNTRIHATASSVLTLNDLGGCSKVASVVAESVIQVVREEYDPVLDQIVIVIEGLQDSAGCGRSRRYYAQNVIPLVQLAKAYAVRADAMVVSAENTIALTDQSWKNEVGLAMSALNLSQVAGAYKGKPTASVIHLTDAAGVSVVRKRSASSVIELKQSVSYSIVRAGVLHRYHPYVGTGASGAPTPPPSTLAGPVEGVTTSFQLRYPATGAMTDSVTLRAPNLGNKDRLVFNRISRETRGGTLIVYADPIWPKIQTLALTFSGLQNAEIKELLRFNKAHLGQEIGLLDWEHRYWTGVIMTPNDPIVQDSKDSYSASFEFEGELDPDWTP